MAEEKKKPGKGKGGKAAPRGMAASAKPKTAARRTSTAAGTKPATPTAATRTPGTKAARKPEAAAAPGSATVARQSLVGYALIAVSAAGIAGTGAWFGPDPMQSALHWAGRAVVQGVCAALIALFVWAALSRWRTVSYVLILGLGATGLLAWDAATAWRVDRAIITANRTLAVLEAGQRTIESLTPEERINPYIEAYVEMRNIYWELDARADKEMARYRSRYRKYTEAGPFLDTGRLATTEELWRSVRQIQDLNKRLLRVGKSPPDISDLLLTVSLFNVDDATRSAYATDLRAARNAFVAATAATTARERQSLEAMRLSLEVLLEVEGRYRIDSGQIVFDDPEDAARFAGKADGS